MTGRCRARPAVAGPGRRSDHLDAGQSTVEFVLLLPLIAVLLLSLLQVGVIVRARVLVTHAAREAVREAAVAGSDEAVRRAAVAASDLDSGRLVVDVVRDGRRVQVTVRYVDPTDVAIVGALLGDVSLTSRATMRLE